MYYTDIHTNTHTYEHIDMNMNINVDLPWKSHTHTCHCVQFVALWFCARFNPLWLGVPPFWKPLPVTCIEGNKMEHFTEEMATVQSFSGWWFGCHFLFSHILGISSSQLTFIFFRGVAQPPTSFLFNAAHVWRWNPSLGRRSTRKQVVNLWEFDSLWWKITRNR